MSKVTKQVLTDDQIEAALIGAQAKDAPVYRAIDQEPPERVCLTAESARSVGGGRTKIVYFADIYRAKETAEFRLRWGSGLKGLHTNWELWGHLPELLPGAHIGGLYVGQTIKLPVNGVALYFKVTVAG